MSSDMTKVEQNAVQYKKPGALLVKFPGPCVLGLKELYHSFVSEKRKRRLQLVVACVVTEVEALKLLIS